MNQETINTNTGEITTSDIIEIGFSKDRLKILKAMLSVQSEMGVASKDSTNPHFKSRYADYKSVWDAVGPILNQHKVLYTIIPSGGPRLYTYNGLLMHESGEFMKCSIQIEASKAGPQEFGSLSTYMKRYILQLLTGVATDEDDDGNKASGPKNNGFNPGSNKQPYTKGNYKPNPNAAKTPQDAKKQVNPSPNAAPKPQPKPQAPPPEEFPPFEDIDQPIDPLDAALMDTPLDDEPEFMKDTPPQKEVKNYAPKAPPKIENDFAHCSSHPEDYIVEFGTKFVGQKLSEVNVIDLSNMARGIEERDLDKTDKKAREFMNFYNLFMAKRFQGGR